MTPSHEDQGSGYDPAARGYELQGRQSAPDPELPATDAREDFAADPVETLTVKPAFDPVTVDSRSEAAPVAPASPPAAQTAQDGPKAPDPATAAPAPPTALPLPFVAYPENHPAHPSRLPPAARPARQGN